MQPKQPNPLATLPIHIRQVPRTNTFVNSHTGERYSYTKALSIAQAHTPKPAPDHAAILEKRWDLRMDTHEINEDGLYIRTAQGI